MKPETLLEKYHLKSSSFFDFLTPQETSYVKEKMTVQEFLKGELLFKENSYSKGVYLLRKGKVKIFQTNKRDGKESIVYIYKRGDYFGYRPLLSHQPHPTSARAMDNVVAYYIPREVFMKLLDKSLNLSRKLLEILSKEFSVWINKMTSFSQYAVEKRVALGLLILTEVYRKNNEKTKQINIVINRDDFAGFVGTAKETLVRTLRVFKNKKIIAAKGTKIIILKYGALLEIVSEVV